MSSPLELDKQAGLSEMPYVPGWSMPRSLEEALTEVKKLREHYAAKCMELDQALTQLTDASGQLVELGSQKGVISSQRDQLRDYVFFLSRRLAKHDGTDPVAAQAMDYLVRHDLLGTPVRKGDDNGT